MRDTDFTRLYSDHAQPLYAFLSYRTGDAARAEDLLAETFEHALRARGRFDARRGSERTWLYAIALNLIRDQARAQRAETRALARIGAGSDGEVCQPGWPEGLERRDALRDALTVLTDAEREAVALRFGADLSLAEVAKLIEEPRSTAESRIYSALRKLREALGEQF